MDLTIVETILSIILLIVIILLVFIYFKLNKLNKFYTQLIKDVEAGNLEKLVSQHLKKVEQNSKKQAQLSKDLEDFKHFSKHNIQKVGFRRYNPFHQTGGDQSFILVLLDMNNNGIILSSLHQRDVTRIYAKQVEKGICDNKLSKEEKNILSNIMQK